MAKRGRAVDVAGRRKGGKARANITAAAFAVANGECHEIAPSTKRFPAPRETSLKQVASRSNAPPELIRRGCGKTAAPANPRRRRPVSTVALSRYPSRVGRGIGAVATIGSSIWSLIYRRIRTGNDMRVLQTLPDHVLADIGLQKMEFLSGSDGSRHVWVIPHRYY
jgi:hypothetical protein